MPQTHQGRALGLQDHGDRYTRYECIADYSSCRFAVIKCKDDGDAHRVITRVHERVIDRNHTLVSPTKQRFGRSRPFAAGRVTGPTTIGGSELCSVGVESNRLTVRSTLTTLNANQPNANQPRCHLLALLRYQPSIS